MRLYLTTTFSLLLFALFVASSACTQTLRMNSQFTATAAGSEIDQWFATEVAKATNGEVKIKIFWAGALGGPKENLSLLSSGAIDMAAMSPAYFPSDLPFFTAPNSLPMTMDNLRQVSELMPRLINEVPAFQKEAANHSIRPLFFHLFNPYLLMSRTPLLSLADLKGKRIRTWGEDLPKLFVAAGATPANILVPEIYENLQHRVIDAIPFSVDMAITYKTYEVTKHISEVVIWMGPAWGVWINEETWKKISPENQARIEEVVKLAKDRELETIAVAEKTARQTLAAAGVQFHPFPTNDLTKWQQLAPDFYADWIAKMAQLGQEADARKTVAIMKQVRRNFQ